MSPPIEQLIRDYLNRLSVAARGQLGQDDRRALVERTRDFIERQTGLAGPPSPIEVGRLLNGLGDPATLVQQERRRLAATRGEISEPPAERNLITRVLRRDSGKSRRTSWQWPVVANGRADLQLALLDSGGAANGGAANGGAANGGAANSGPGGSNGRKPDPALGEEQTHYVPEQGADPDWFFRALSDESQSAREPPNASAIEVADAEEVVDADDIAEAEVVDADDVAEAEVVDAEDVIEGEVVFEAEEVVHGDEAEPDATTNDATTTADDGPAWQFTTGSAPVLARQFRRAFTATAEWCQRRPLEASAVALLGIGGAIYPPVWLLGAVVALASRVWDGPDKWAGLALPPLLTVIAAALGITLGGHGSLSHAMHEGWVFGVAGSRAAAALGAAYLCRRSVHGRRPPAVPPWNRPHKVG